MKLLVYSSVAKRRTSDDEIEHLLVRSRTRNAELGISGVLLAGGGRFVQLIEGPRAAISQLYGKIEQDPRHHSVVKLLERDVEERLFEGWSMGFRRLGGDAMGIGIETLHETYSTRPDSALAMIKRIAEGFTPTGVSPCMARERVLIVDDKPDNLRILATLLTEEGFEPQVARNGEIALRSVMRSRPDLILLDVDMPGMNGFEVCSKLQLDPALREIPVIFVSALGDTSHKVAGLQVGACDYVTKPFQIEEVIARVRTHLELARLRRERNESLVLLEEKNRRLDMFARSLAHDMRSPLTVILGCSSMLSLDLEGAEEEIAESLDSIQQAAENLNETIDSLLLLAVADTSKNEFAPVDVGQVAKTCRDDLRSMADGYGGEIIVSEIPQCIGNGPWLRRILTNLISNGLKYGGRPPIVKVSGELLSADRVQIAVEDNGIGMTEEDLAGLFNEFARFAPDAAPGIGLGLVLVKTLVEQMGGRIHVESTLAKGSRFMIELQSNQPEHPFYDRVRLVSNTEENLASESSPSSTSLFT